MQTLTKFGRPLMDYEAEKIAIEQQKLELENLRV
jgi:hypothetical protein